VGGEAKDILARIRRFAMPAGSEGCGGTCLRQVGKMRLAEDRPWMPFLANQSFLGDGIEFRWRARVRVAPLLWARVEDAFQGGRGVLEATVFGLLPVARSRGPATDVGEAMRGLAELPFRPSAFREGGGIEWKAGGEDRLSATIQVGPTRATVEFEVDAEGRVLGCHAARRPRLVGKELVETGWRGEFARYRELDGLRVPTLAEVAWELPEGRFSYFRGRVVAFRRV
jgi:hypothetical protein